MNVWGGSLSPDLYRGFQRVLIVQNRIETALEVGEQGRIKAFEQWLDSHECPATGFAEPIASPNIRAIAHMAARTQTTLIEYSLVYDYDLFNQNPWIDKGFDRLYGYATELYIWVVPPQGKVQFRRIYLEKIYQEYGVSLAGLVRNLRKAIARQCDPSSMDDEGKTGLDIPDLLAILYQILIEPIAPWLPDDPSRRVSVIPQDFLFLVPFAALADRQGRPLIEKHTLLLAPAIETLGLPQAPGRSPQPTRSRCALVVGSVKMPRVALEFGEPPLQLPSLRDSETEALAIADFLNVEAFVGDRATKNALLQQWPDAAIVHLATPVFVEDTPGLSETIALSPDNRHNGLCRIWELFAPTPGSTRGRDNPELLVLSGCDPKPGRLQGHHFFWLCWSAIAAGIPSLLLSSWRPPQGSTTPLLLDFYREWQATGDRAISWRRATLAARERNADLAHWAAFVLVESANGGDCTK
jgi:CHAT domain-containing protein